MNISPTLRRWVTWLILGLSLLFWIILLIPQGESSGVRHCSMTASGPSQASLEMLLAMNPPGPLLLGWALMVLGMMLPKIIGALLYICERSFPRRRFQAMLLFILGYIGIWLIAGIPVIGMVLGFNLLMPRSYLPAIIVGLIALIWQCSPLKQRCLNRGHDHRTLAAFGWKVHRDALLFGIVHGLWCVGSGWALMFFPMLLPTGHNPAMFAISVLMISEHLDHPRIPHWRLNFSSKLLRMLIAQTDIRLQKSRTSRIITE